MSHSDLPYGAKAGLAPAGNTYRGALAGLTAVMAVVFCFSAVVNVLMLTGSIYMLQVYDRVLTSGSVPTLLVLFAIVVLLYAFLGCFDFLRARLLSRAALQLDQRLGAPGFLAWIEAGVPGKAAPSQPMRDLDSLRGFLAGPTVTALFDLPFVPLYLGVLFVVHPWLGWLTVAGAAVTAILALLNRALTDRPVREAADLDATERAFTERSHQGAEAILAMGMQHSMVTRWRSMRNATLARGQNGSDPSEILAAASKAFRMLLQSAILTLGAYLVIKAEISGGMIIASSVLTGRALAPVDQLISQWRAIGKASTAHKHLDTFFASRSPTTAPIALPDPTGQVSVTGLTRLGPKRPGRDQSRILSEINFALSPGDGMGVIGNSACGKSTLARLLVGVTRPDSGEIRFDGATPDQWDPAQLGRQIGYLPQVVGLLPGTIRDNIARFDRQAKDVDIIAAAQMTGVHEMILQLPDGYGTQLGRPGEVPLSGGQIQRLGLARAIFGMPKLVVLDEPNANLDVAGDDALTQTIIGLRQAGSTVIVMAHRPSAIAAVNKLLILRSGIQEHFGDKAAILARLTGQTDPAPYPGARPAQTPPDGPARPPLAARNGGVPRQFNFKAVAPPGEPPAQTPDANGTIRYSA